MQIPLNRILVYIITGICLIIAGGTILEFSLHRAVPGKGLRKTDPTPAEFHQDSVFDDFGQIRTITRPKEGSSSGVTVVITPWISWPGHDTAFHEELVQKKRKIKSIITHYFSEYTETELLAKGEPAVKNDLLHIINGELILGKITAIYFSEYIFLE